MSKFGFPWEQDYQRAKKSKKGQKKILSYRNSRRQGPKKRTLQKEKGWYVAYLQSDHWKEFKCRYTLSKQPQKCIICGSSKFDLHHRTYERIWREHLTDVVPLCRLHHKQTHKLVKQGYDLKDAHKKLKKD